MIMRLRQETNHRKTCELEVGAYPMIGSSSQRFRPLPPSFGFFHLLIPHGCRGHAIQNRELMAPIPAPWRDQHMSVDGLKWYCMTQMLCVENVRRLVLILLKHAGARPQVFQKSIWNQRQCAIEQEK